MTYTNQSPSTFVNNSTSTSAAFTACCKSASKLDIEKTRELLNFISADLDKLQDVYINLNYLLAKYIVTIRK